MAYRTKTLQRQAAHKWYVAHKELTWARSRKWKRLHSELIKTNAWYHRVRRKICKGGSTNELSEEKRNLWWAICEQRVIELQLRIYGEILF